MRPALRIQSAVARAVSADGYVDTEVVAAVVAHAPKEEDALLLTLDNRGKIRDCRGPSERLFRLRCDELIQRHISLLLPELEALELVRNGEADHRFRYQCRIGRHFLAVTGDGEYFASKLFLNVLDSSGDGRLTLIIRPAEATNHGESYAWRPGNSPARQSAQVAQATSAT